MKKLKHYFLITGIILSMAACNPNAKEADDDGSRGSQEENSEMMEGADKADNSNMKDQKMAMAEITSASNSKLTGTAKFTQMKDGKVKMELNVENGTEGKHAVHIHEKGDCSAADAKSAGGHWNPTNVEHGKRNSGTFHKGDIGNMDIDKDGKGNYSVTVDDWSIGGAEDSNIVGKALIIHAGADDFKSQPSGAAGDRIGCGEIQMNR